MGCPTEQFGLMFMGVSRISVPFANGSLCAGGPQQRFPIAQTSASGGFNYGPGLPPNINIDGLASSYFQAWYRDTGAPCGAFSNFSHRRPHSKGGSREARNLLLLCGEHHFQQEIGIVTPVGPTSNPLWFLPDGWIVSKRRPGGYEPETDRERRALEALRARERKREGRR